MGRKEDLRDKRWLPYKEVYNTLPIFCFNDLKYPESYEEAVLQISRLELEQKNIESQFLERETELASMHGPDKSNAEDEYKKWKTKALRAQRMKFSQVRLLEAWMLDYPPSYDERIKALEQKTAQLEKALAYLPKVERETKTS